MKVFRFFALYLASVLFGVVVNAQTIKVTGTVTKSGSGEPVIGAVVIVSGT